MVLVACLSGCAISTQRFEDISYNENGSISRSVVLSTKTVAPPFGSKAITEKLMLMQESDDGWELQIGTESLLEGGDVSLITESVITGITDVLIPIP